MPNARTIDSSVPSLQQNLRTDISWFLERAKAPRLRSMREFAETEIVIPDGPFEGRRFRCSRQPYTGLWFDAVDSGRWQRCVATGPTQSGKTLSCFVIPMLYHLFEVGETVICGLPDMDMAADKWREDILPVIEQSQYRSLLPKQGSGSRGGKVESIQFVNGATLKFMSGGGGDKSRAGFTARVVVVTETDGMDKPGASSRESDKITQLEARTRAYGSQKRIYLECTVSTEQGRTWREYFQGTRSAIVLPCPHCREWVSPERDHLGGWPVAKTLAAARTESSFFCPNCGERWSEAERREANADGRLLHNGQTVDGDGIIKGDPPATDTLGFRWSAVHNMFLTAGDLGGDEWRASRSVDEENAEREMRQFVWCIPIQPSKYDVTALEAMELASRVSDSPKGIVPSDCLQLTAAIDIGKYLLHWVVVAWRVGATGTVVDYGAIRVAGSELGLEQAILAGLREFRERVLAGWPVGGTTDQKRVPTQVWVDSGYMTEVVYHFIRESDGNVFRPAIGRGAAQQYRQYYNRPTKTGSLTKYIGQGFHVNQLPSDRIFLVEVDADFWKTWVHQRLSAPVGASGAMTFYRAQPHEHLTLVKHITAESKMEEFVPGQGVRTKWERMRRQNHWFDALYNASAAGYLAGARLVAEAAPPPAPRARLVASHGCRSDGRPWIDNNRGTSWGMY